MSAFQIGIVNNLKRSSGGNFLTFSSDNPFSLSFRAKRWDGVLEYSTDARNWTEWDASEISSVDNVLYLRGLGNSVITAGTGATHAMIMTSPTGSGISCAGNIMTLLDYVSPETAVMGDSCYRSMFQGCSNLTAAPELPATTLSLGCYRSMFQDCPRLTTAPELPATTLSLGCYISMFWGCTILSTAPELPATTLAANCYNSMFYNCPSIKISEGPTGIYQKPWRIPTVGTIINSPSGWNTSMLSGTGGSYRLAPVINTTYYQAE